MKVARRLVAEGFVDAVRGRSGGLQLASAADQINVGRVARTMEETGSFVDCFNAETSSCAMRCPAGWTRLDRYSLSDWIKSPAAVRESLLSPGADR